MKTLVAKSLVLAALSAAIVFHIITPQVKVVLPACPKGTVRCNTMCITVGHPCVL